MIAMRKLKITELNRLTPEAFKDSEKIPLVVVLDHVRSLNNVGSVFRTSDAFRVKSIYLCGITACPPHAEIHKTALGAEETVGWEYFEDTMDAVDKLKQMCIRDSKDILSVRLNRPRGVRCWINCCWTRIKSMPLSWETK